MSDYVLVLNAGSSSLKFRVYERTRAAGWHAAANGAIEAIGTAARLTAVDGLGASIADGDLPAVREARGALDALADWLRSRYAHAQVLGVGHRVVDGGARYAEPTLVTGEVLDDLNALVPLAPLHQPHNLAAIAAVLERMPEVPQVACFDTAFHRGKPAVAALVPLPKAIRHGGVQRYGFHGLSYEHIAQALPRTAPAIARGRVIVAHLGSGASLCALRDGKSVDCTLGFTALDGLCMGTRPGAVDAGVILHLFQTLGLTQIGAFAAVLGGVDALVFTAGIGERSAEIRARICAASAWLGVELDDEANARHGPRITTSDARVSAWVVPTDEELMIARHTGRLLGLTSESEV